MKNIKLTIEYDGTNYHGWQIQQNAVTVQGTLEKALSKLTGEEISVIGCSRTDVGVHSYGQTANFFTDSSIPADKFSYAVNNQLPPDIVIQKSEEVQADFHSRYSARGKKYRYIIYNNEQPSALQRSRAWHVKPELDVDKMKTAAKYFEGQHDFAAFQATGGQVRSSVRTIYNMSVEKQGHSIILEVAGNGFLYNMVRIIAGTLAYVGMGKIKADAIPDIIAGLDRTKAGITAPALGLYLVEIFY